MCLYQKINYGLTWIFKTYTTVPHWAYHSPNVSRDLSVATDNSNAPVLTLTCGFTVQTYCHLFNCFPNEHLVFPPNYKKVINSPSCRIVLSSWPQEKASFGSSGNLTPHTEPSCSGCEIFLPQLPLLHCPPFFLPLVEFKLLSLDSWPPCRPPSCQAPLFQVNPWPAACWKGAFKRPNQPCHVL